MLKKSVVWYLVLAMFAIATAPRAEGAFIPSGAIELSKDQRASDLGKIQNLLETKLVRQRLLDLGFNADEAKERLSLLSDTQLHSYAQQLDTIRAGGDSIGAVIGVLIIIILVLVILHLTGHQVIVR
ncbi:MAG: hypothetical protein C4526_01615 [Nitrospiraceae bacterium]|nr:MAG: hypothetical protein C4526_01615 [Nitrospiraceae bacterium]